MKFSATMILFLTIAFFTTPPATAETQALQNIVNAGNSFAVDLYKQTAIENSNLFISPLSVHLVMGMVYAGARNETATQLAEVLHFNSSSQEPHEGFAELLDLLNSPHKSGVQRKPTYELTLANALWGQDPLDWEKSFEELTGEYYWADLNMVNFSNPSEAASTINNWSSKETKGKIETLIAPEDITPLTRLVLTNSIYFKASWMREFMPSETSDQRFHLTPSKRITVPLMHQRNSFLYMETESFQMVELPYMGRDLVMDIFLPREISGLKFFEEKLTTKKLDEWIEKLSLDEVVLSLPKFSFKTGINLSKNLETMGLAEAFTRDADFSGITSQEGMYISKVLHKSFIILDESGTEAAAATAAVMVLEALVSDVGPKVFRADHPFSFVIRHRTTGAILFMGRLVNPLEKLSE